MTEGVNTQETADPVRVVDSLQVNSDKEMNFRRLEQAKEEARERAQKAEIESALLRQRLEMLEARNQPQERDALEGVEDYVDPKVLKTALEQRDRRFKKEAEEIAERKWRELKEKDKQENHVERLQSQYSDYNQIMNEKNIVELEQANPEFVQSLLHIKDDYERKKLAYSHLKRNMRPKEENRPSIKDKVDENAKNPYYIPPGSGTPSAVDFDLKSPQARASAYEKLKAAQRRPIGSGQS